MPMNAAHLAPQGGGFDPQRAFDFEIELYGVPGQELIKLSVDSTTLPATSNEIITVHFMGEERKVPGKAKVSNGSIVVKDFVTEDVFSTLQQWRDLVYDNESGNINLAPVYKRKGAVFLIGPDGARRREYTLDGVWPSQVQGGALSYAQSQAFTLTLTLVVDRAKMG